MASAASLLFKINADSDEAEATIQKFRALMGKDLDDLESEFSEWSNKVFGSLDTVKGGMIALGAAAATAFVVAAGVMTEASGKYNEYVGEVSHAMRLTGQSAETLSILHLAAAETRTSFDSLTTGIVKFEGNIVKGAEGSDQMLGSFRKLGISQDDLKAGQQDMLPLLGKVMDGFKGTASAVDRTALARELFSRGGAEMLGFLNKGSAGLAEFSKKAEELGLIIHTKDVDAFKELKSAEEQFRAQHEALDMVIGKSTIGLETWYQTMKAAAAQTLSAGKGMHGGVLGPVQDVLDFVSAYQKITAEIKKQSEIAEHAPPVVPPDAAPKLEKVLSDYFGISAIVEAMRGKIASFGDEHTKLAVEMAKYSDETIKAQAELQKLEKEGKITAESAAAQSAALTQIPQLITQIWQAELEKQTQLNAEAWKKKNDADLQALNDLRAKVAAATESGFEGQRAALGREIEAMRAGYQEKGQLTGEMLDTLEALYNAGIAKIAAAEQAEADKSDAIAKAKSAKADQQFAQEMGKLEEHQLQILAANQTGAEKLNLEYQKDLQRFSQVEEAKAVSALTSEAEIAAIHQRYADVRAAIATKYGADLQTLLNSQGWQGVFGSKFTAGLKGNENLLREWASSANQSLMLVKVSLQNLKQIGKDAFDSLTQAMGQNTVAAFINSKSIGQAAEAAVASTLTSIAEQAAVQAIYAAAWGFYDLAIGFEQGAVAAFEAAGMFAVVAGAGAVGAKALTPPSASTGAAADASASAPGVSTGATDSSTPAAAAAAQQPYVQVNVYGHVVGPSGISQLTDLINDGVQNSNVKLVASHNPAGVSLR